MSLDIRTQKGPHVFVRDLDRPELDDDDRHHLTKSLRLRDGDPMTVSDGQGAWRSAAFGTSLEVTGDIQRPDAPAYAIGLGIALTKAAKPEFAVQKATEIGVDELIVFEATFSIARWDESKRAKNQQRLERVAREAAMQSRRVTIPTIEIVQGLDVVVANRSVVRADFGAVSTNLADSATARFVLIGPEGGWSAAEIELVPATVNLGPTVLRAETAAVVAATFLASSRD